MLVLVALAVGHVFMVFAVDPYALRAMTTGGYDESRSPEALNARPFLRQHRQPDFLSLKRTRIAEDGPRIESPPPPAAAADEHAHASVVAGDAGAGTKAGDDPETRTATGEVPAAAGARAGEDGARKEDGR
jgi:hypothetical protein